jgi:PHD/YefM family antitoxin component YafN of YafNO toxin-antitoxin module
MAPRGCWELAAALAVLDRARQEVLLLRAAYCDREMLRDAEDRCRSAQRIVDGIRDKLRRDREYSRRLEASW